MEQNNKQDNAVKQFNEIVNALGSATVDTQSTKNERYAEGLQKAHMQVVKRNELLTNLLQNYINRNEEKNETNKRFKKILFYVFVGILVILTVAVFFVFVRVNFNIVEVPLVVSLLSVGATYLGSLFAVYEIMFKYLFPAEEEKDMISMIKTVIENDLKIEEFALRLNTSQKLENTDGNKPETKKEQ